MASCDARARGLPLALGRAPESYKPGQRDRRCRCTSSLRTLRPTINTSSSVTLLAGYRYDIKLEFQEFGGGAVMQLSWRPPGAGAFAALPSSALYPL